MDIMNWIDIALLALLLLFAVFGFIAGFTEKFFSIASWVGAGLLTSHVYPWLKPFGKQFISNDTLASIATFGIIFLILLIIFKLATGRLSRSVKGSPLGSLDRALGVILGVFTGLFLLASLCLLNRAFFNVLGNSSAFNHSKVWAFTQMNSAYLEKLLPNSVAKPLAKKKSSDLALKLSRPCIEQKKTGGYKTSDRAQLSQITKTYN
jgi:membrane protein required for colicin V production